MHGERNLLATERLDLNQQAEVAPTRALNREESLFVTREPPNNLNPEAYYLRPLFVRRPLLSRGRPVQEGAWADQGSDLRGARARLAVASDEINQFVPPDLEFGAASQPDARRALRCCPVNLEAMRREKRLPAPVLERPPCTPVSVCLLVTNLSLISRLARSPGPGIQFSSA